MAATVLAADSSARFSHVGLVVRNGAQALVIHAVPEEADSRGGVVQDTLEGFLSAENAADFAIYRPRRISGQQQDTIRREAFALMGTPFDFDLRLSDDRSVYCSELVIRAFARAGVEFGVGLRSVRTIMMSEPAIAPDGLRNSALLVEITDSVIAE